VNLEILAFPCNNFASQEPGTNAEILEFAKGKGAEYPILGKVQCDNGDKTHPVYQYLKASLDNGLVGRGLKWNFAKFLCNAEGVPVKRYFPTTSPMGIENDIIALIEEQSKQ
jgi:glutathione peroxidase